MCKIDEHKKDDSIQDFIDSVKDDPLIAWSNTLTSEAFCQQALNEKNPEELLRTELLRAFPNQPGSTYIAQIKSQLTTDNLIDDVAFAYQKIVACSASHAAQKVSQDPKLSWTTVLTDPSQHNDFRKTDEDGKNNRLSFTEAIGTIFQDVLPRITNIQSVSGETIIHDLLVEKQYKEDSTSLRFNPRRPGDKEPWIFVQNCLKDFNNTLDAAAERIESFPDKFQDEATIKYFIQKHLVSEDEYNEATKHHFTVKTDPPAEHISVEDFTKNYIGVNYQDYHQATDLIAFDWRVSSSIQSLSWHSKLLKLYADLLSPTGKMIAYENSEERALNIKNILQDDFDVQIHKIEPYTSSKEIKSLEEFCHFSGSNYFYTATQEYNSESGDKRWINTTPLELLPRSTISSIGFLPYQIIVTRKRGPSEDATSVSPKHKKNKIE